MVFEEKQGLKIWWLYLIIGVTTVPTLAIFFFYKGGQSFDDLRRMFFAPILAVLSPFVIIFVIQQSKLTLIINSEGISYRYFPFIIKPRFYAWAAIEKAYIRKYDAFSEYGGFGIKHRLWFKLKDKAYILNDKNKGLQVILKNGRKVLFSTHKKAELELFLANLRTEYNIQAIQ